MAAIKTDGTLWLWGDNSYGQLGDNTIVRKSSPVQTIAFGTNWSQVDVGWLNTAAIKTDGTLWIWGDNSNGQLGDNTIVRKSSPVQTIAGGTNWKQVSCSKNRLFTAAIKTDGTLWTWGQNSYGQLGDNTITRRSSPVQTIAGGTNWKQISVGSTHTAAIKNDGTLWMWGRNDQGQLAVWGGGTPATSGDPGTSPVTVSGSKTNATTFTTSNTTGVSIGMNVYTSTQPVDWTTVSAISTNVSITFTPSSFTGTWTGTISLGIGAIKATAATPDFINNRSSPVQTVAFGTNWKQVYSGNFDTAAIKTDGTLWTWGINDSGQLGDNTITKRSSPVQTIAGGSNWKQVSINRSNTAAIQYQDDYQ
jgi:alpha-tubulin suppressor-like RCC1 family protein